MQKIVVLNPKGGSGKTTIAINLASYFALDGRQPALMDMDAQGSSIRWLRKRLDDQAHIYGIAAYERKTTITRSWHLRIPVGTERLIVDTPAALSPQDFPEICRGADKILVPVLPSDIDIQAASRCISDLLLAAKIRRRENRIGILANRVRRNTVVYRSLMRFLNSLGIPIIATIRDTQNYVYAAEHGLGIHEMAPHRVNQDITQWRPLLAWLAERPLHVVGGTEHKVS